MTCEMNRVGDDELQLIDFSEEDDYLIAFPFRDSLEDLRLSVTYDNLNECDRIKLFESINSQVVERIDQAQFESMEPRRPSFLRKSLAWDNAFFTSAGVLNLEELFMINKGFKKPESNHQTPRNKVTLKNQTSSGINQSPLLFNHHLLHILYKNRGFKYVSFSASKKSNICSQNKVKPVSGASKLVSSKHTNKASVEESESYSMKTKHKSRKAGLGTDLNVSKRSRWGDLSGLPKSTSFTSQKDLKADSSYESSSSASSSSKSSRKEINHKNTKPTSSTSPCSSIEGWLSSSSSNTPEYATTSSMETLLSSGPKRKIKSSGLRMPSPKIGFFDEGQPFKGSMQEKQSPLQSHNRNRLNKNKLQLSNLSPSVTPENCSKVRKAFNDGRKSGVSFSKLKVDVQIQKEISNKRMHIEEKKQKDEAMIDMKQKQDESDQKENVFSFEDQVNGLTKCLEVIDLDRDVGPEVKGQLSRTPLAEKVYGKH
ncbi:uncharacterized protein LOC111895289 isoform X1 [Lactuca sativa]|uniref:uncharacterized protein LOC111895289 isoform X1 n=1 Tax=Lactuca sativa TaxID=4236 RepID=UPI000CC08340|nr:uncharacterized protein LOC111895289 isoform X1 [Lactuca sativa]